MKKKSGKGRLTTKRALVGKNRLTYYKMCDSVFARNVATPPFVELTQALTQEDKPTYNPHFYFSKMEAKTLHTTAVSTGHPQSRQVVYNNSPPPERTCKEHHVYTHTIRQSRNKSESFLHTFTKSTSSMRSPFSAAPGCPTTYSTFCVSLRFTERGGRAFSEASRRNGTQNRHTRGCWDWRGRGSKGAERSLKEKNMRTYMYMLRASSTPILQRETLPSKTFASPLPSSTTSHNAKAICTPHSVHTMHVRAPAPAQAVS